MHASVFGHYDNLPKAITIMLFIFSYARFHACFTMTSIFHKNDGHISAFKFSVLKAFIEILCRISKWSPLLKRGVKYFSIWRFHSITIPSFIS